jgi:hypothetical protein
MNQRIECGTYRVAEKKVYHYAGYECAAWSQDVEVAAGDYPVVALVEGSHVKYFLVTLPGVIVEDFFPSLFGGMAIGKPYDTKQNAGKSATYRIQCDDYIVFQSIARGLQSPWNIDISMLPNLGICLNPECGSFVSIYNTPRYCPSCAVAREKEGKKAIEARHNFLLEAAYVGRPTEFGSILDSTIYQYFEAGKQGYHRDELVKVIAGLRKAGPEGRKKARASYSPRSRNRVA